MNNHGKYSLLVEAARAFIRKVDTGKARSIESYRSFKEALEEVDFEEKPKEKNGN